MSGLGNKMPSTGLIELKSNAGDSVRCRVSDSFWSRFMGLMGKPGLPSGEGLLIRPCNSIHMFFMRFSIDALFLDRDYSIVKLVRNLTPGAIVGTVPGACQVLEIASGSTPPSFMENTRLIAEDL
jgi:uncharacterized membrane protein (UPF0127 family)